MRFWFGEDGSEVVDIADGEVLHIPSYLPHAAEALEATLDVDIFCPLGPTGSMVRTRTCGLRVRHERREPLDALFDQRLVDHAEREPDVLAAAIRPRRRASRGRSRRRARPRVTASAVASHPGIVSQEKNPPSARVQCDARRHGALERRQQALALAAYSARDSTSCSSIQPRRMYSSSIRCPSAPEHWSVFCLADDELRGDLGRARPPSRAARPGRTSSTSSPPARRRPAPRLQRLGGRVVVEAELAVGDVLDDQEAVAACKLDQRAAPLGGQAHSRRVLVIRDRVEELRPQPAGKQALELVDLRARPRPSGRRRPRPRSRGTP